MRWWKARAFENRYCRSLKKRLPEAGASKDCFGSGSGPWPVHIRGFFEARVAAPSHWRTTCPSRTLIAVKRSDLPLIGPVRDRDTD